MQGIAAEVLAQLRIAEGWSSGNVLGAALLGLLVIAAVVTAVLVGRRR